MDFAKLLFFILIIGFAIFKELGSSAKKEKAARMRERKPVPPMPLASAYASASTAISPADASVPPKPYSYPMPPAQSAKPENASTAPVFEEGMRVTADIPPMAPNTPSVNRESVVPDLSDPANLRAAIIFSEILAPKF